MKKTLLLIIPILLFTFKVNAQWVNAGISGVYILGVGTDSSNIFATTIGTGSYLSINDGLTWTTDSLNIDAEEFAVNSNYVFAGGRAGVARSGNEGISWTTIDSGIETNYLNYTIKAIATSNDTVIIGTENGIYLSYNNGTNWLAIDTGILSGSLRNVSSLAIEGSTFFASTNKGVITSNNGGLWIASNVGLNTLTDSFITCLAVNGSYIFAGTAGGMFLSTNNGISWNKINTGLSDTFVQIIAISTNNIFVGTPTHVFLSTNNGNNWSNISKGLPDSGGAIINSLAANDSSVFAGISIDPSGGVWKASILQLTGIQQVQSAQTEFTCYPNPASNHFTCVTSNTEKQLLQVYDITGKLVLSQNINSFKVNIDISNLPNGIFDVRLLGDNDISNQKLVVIK